MIFKKDYFGYVYEWTNIKNGKKYIGSHYGSVNDSYAGSGKYFKPAYNKNPENFKMIVLEFLMTDDKRLLLELEQNWLDSVPDIKNNKEYYNFNNYSSGGFRHLTKKHIQQRSETLKEKHLNYGLSTKEKDSYKTKIQTRLDRIKKIGFTAKEQEQHSKYGFQIKVILPSGEEKIYNSCSQAKKDLGIDALYGLRVCDKKEFYKNHKFIKLRDPIIDCR